MLTVSIFLCLVPNVTRVYFSVSCAQCCPCLSFCVLCPMLPVSIFLCLVANVARVIFQCLVPNIVRVYFSVSCAQCCPCLFFCVLCPILPVSRNQSTNYIYYCTHTNKHTKKQKFETKSNIANLNIHWLS